MGPDGGRPGRPIQAVRHTCSGKLRIVKILRYIRSDMYTAFFGRKMGPLANGALYLSIPKHNGKSGTGWNGIGPACGGGCQVSKADRQKNGGTLVLKHALLPLNN